MADERMIAGQVSSMGAKSSASSKAGSGGGGRPYDDNLFLDCQFVNHHMNWVLRSPAAEGGTSYDTIILRGIANDNHFEFTGNHEWGPGDSFGTTQLAKSVTNKLNQLSEQGKVSYNLFDTLAKKSGVAPNGIKAALDSGIDKIMGNNSGIGSMMKGLGQKVIDEMGGHYITAFDHVKVFKGTNLEISFPTLTTRIYHNQWKSQSVLDVLDVLFYRFIGKLVRPLDSGENPVTTLFGIQRAPNGYSPAFNTLSVGPDTIIPGTFELTYCGFVIPNLLITNFGFKLSTMRVRQAPGGWNGDPLVLENTTSPLYVDVSIQVQPCTFISKEVMAKIIASKYTEDTVQMDRNEQ